ncbi:MAG: hypothetical protein ACFFA3_14575 [Promethearchaeota archaeon]
MTQTYEKVMEMEKPREAKAQISEESKRDELLGDLNPRYFEEAIVPEKALDRVYANRNINHLIRPF